MPTLTARPYFFGFFAEKPVSWMMVAPSLAPNKSPGVSNNPGLRLYKFIMDSGHVSTFFRAGQIRSKCSYRNLFHRRLSVVPNVMT